MLKRILVSPFIFIANTFIVYGGIIFPTTMIMMFSFMQLIFYPFQDIINWATETKWSEDSWPGTPIVSVGNKYIGAFLGLTPLIWFPFYATYRFIVDNEVILK